MNSTTYYELSQILADDKPTWLAMYNSDMEKIDAGIHEAKAAADNAQATATSADGKADTNAAAITNLGNALDSAVSTLGTVQGSVNTLNSLMGNGTPTTSDQTVIGAINALEATIAASEDGDNFANDYQIGEQFMRGGTLYEALTAIARNTAWNTLELNTNYKISDRIAKQISDIQEEIDNLDIPDYEDITSDVSFGEIGTGVFKKVIKNGKVITAEFKFTTSEAAVNYAHILTGLPRQAGYSEQFYPVVQLVSGSTNILTTEFAYLNDTTLYYIGTSALPAGTYHGIITYIAE